MQNNMYALKIISHVHKAYRFHEDYSNTIRQLNLLTQALKCAHCTDTDIGSFNGEVFIAVATLHLFSVQIGKWNGDRFESIQELMLDAAPLQVKFFNDGGRLYLTTLFRGKDTCIHHFTYGGALGFVPAPDKVALKWTQIVFLFPTYFGMA